MPVLDNNAIIETFPDIYERISVRATVSVYVNDKYVTTLTDTFDKVRAFCADKKSVTLKLTKYGEDAICKRVKGMWFGIETSAYGGLKASERNYLNSILNYLLRNSKGRKYERGVHNFYFLVTRYIWYLRRTDKNAIHDEIAFNKLLDRFLKTHKAYSRVTDLNQYWGKQGVYVLVNDEYNSCYIGRTNDITKRIRDHWNRGDYFWGYGFDLFNAHDTTRIYVRQIKSFDAQCKEEYRAINFFKEFSMNILRGDLSYLLQNGESLMIDDSPSGGMPEEIRLRRSLYNEFICQ